jgi:hypothetical protein
MIKPARGIELLASAWPYKRAYPDAIYVRGLIFLQMKIGAKAATEFKKIADMRAPVGEPPGSTRIGASTMRCHILVWHAASVVIKVIALSFHIP